MSKLIKHKKSNKNKSGKKHSHSRNSKTIQQRRKLYAKKSKLVKNKKRLSKLNLRGGTGGYDETCFNNIKHIWYQSWPDHGAPDIENLTEMKNFKEFIKVILKDMSDNPGGTVIHCSAGVGRTGTIYIILKLLLEKKISTEILPGNDTYHIPKGIVSYEDIKNAIIEVRKHRMLMVQAYEQLEFIAKFFVCEEQIKPYFLAYLKTIFYQDLQKREINTIPNLENISEDDYNMYLQTYNNKYNAQIGVEQRTTDVEISVEAIKACNKSKNRYGNIIPYDRTRVVLVNPIKDCDDYINANYLNSDLEATTSRVSDEDVFHEFVIGAQCPLPHTKNDFLRMLADENLDIKRIIMVTNFLEPKKVFDRTTRTYRLEMVPKCHDYTKNNALDGASDKGIKTNFGKITDFQLCSDGNNKYDLRYINPELISKPPLSMPTPPPSPSLERSPGGQSVGRDRLETQFTRSKPIQTTYSERLSPEQRQALAAQAQQEITQMQPPRPTQEKPKPLIFGSTPMSRLKSFITNRKFFSGCDCKIILLFCLVHKLFPDNSQEEKIKAMIKINVTSENKNTFTFTDDFFELIKLIGIDKPKKYIVISCNKNSSLKPYLSLSEYLNDKNIFNVENPSENTSNVDDYKQLFGVNDDKNYDSIVHNLEEIFGKGGNYIASNNNELTTDIFVSDYELGDEEL